jgi:thiol:disulfide interchange protein
MKFNYLIVFFLLSFGVFAQIEAPTTWKYYSSNKNIEIGQTIELTFEAAIQDEWYLYSNDFDENLGPLLTQFNFKTNKSYQLVGKPKAIGQKKKIDPVWEGEVSYFSTKAKFVQKVKILEKFDKISGNITFQTCNDQIGKCVNGSQDFEVSLNFLDESKTESILPISEEIGSPQEKKIVNNQIKTETQKPVEQTESLWQFLLLAFGAGLASIFMPCIYPIMPMTVSFFTKQKNGRSKAVFYGISIMVIFGLMGAVTMAFGAPFLNFLSTHWLPNLIFFVVFIIFGISLLGAFEIVLPHETVNKIDRLGDRGGLIGIFFMALTLVLVSFSCTVPLVGTLLIAAAQGEILRPLYGMLAFGLPFALVFSGLAMFPQVLKTLPKSGGWLNELKAVFGFLEFALALKFLSNIDLAYNWELIHRNVFLVIWIVIAVLIGIYLLGYIRLEKDDKITKRSPLRIAFALLFLGLAAYMLPGVTNKPLALLSGILPPLPVEKSISIDSEMPSDKIRNLPHGLTGFYDFDDALEYAQKVNKPILIDFTGKACANCRKMEENVWPLPEVLDKLKNDFVIASLYVDDKKELPKDKQYVSTYDDELKTTVGDKNIDLEITKYNNNAQPLYVIVDTKGEKILEPLGYVSKEEFLNFLKEGKNKFVP